MNGKERVDAELVRRGLFPSREKAQAAIMAADVIAGGAIMGAITGHAMEEDLGSEDKDKDNNK